MMGKDEGNVIISCHFYRISRKVLICFVALILTNCSCRLCIDSVMGAVIFCYQEARQILQR